MKECEKLGEKETNINYDELIYRLLTHQSTAEELRMLNDWLALSPENKRKFDETRDIWLAGKIAKSRITYDYIDAWNSLRQRIKTDGTHRQRFSLQRGTKLSLLFKIAAIVFLFFLGAGSYNYFISQPLIKDHSKTAYTIHQVPYGSKTQITLEDGTKVWLNSGSSLSYSQQFNTTKRVVCLNGEAFFDVVHNTKKPFIVKTSKITIKVLGTAFNVKDYSEEKTIETTVSRGIVQIYTNKSFLDKGTTQKILLHPNQKATYIKSAINKTDISKEEATLAKETDLPIGKIIIDNNISPKVISSWKEKEWIIEHESLQELAIKMERRYDVKINFADNEVRTYIFSGIILDESISQVLNLIKLSAPIKYTMKQKEITFYENKKHNPETINKP